MKRFFTFLLALLMAFSISACNASGTQDESTHPHIYASTQSATNAPTDAVTQPSTEISTEEPETIPTEPYIAPTTTPATEIPTEEPTEAPTQTPTQAPTETPTKAPAVITTDPPDNSKEDMVWVSKTGKKYHSNFKCSNMKEPSHITKQEAEAMGRTPCSKCY